MQLMEKIQTRKNPLIRHFRLLGREAAYRAEKGEFLCDGAKLLSEAEQNKADITAVLLRENSPVPSVSGVPAYICTDEVFDYASPLMHSPGPLFSVRIRPQEEIVPRRVIVLENVQDPGNVGTVFRSAAALGVDLVVLTGSCADPYNPKTVRSAMGALFRQPFVCCSPDELSEKLSRWGLPLYGAALSDTAKDVRCTDIHFAAVAVGNEGKGLSKELLSRCTGQIIIPMTPGSESLNAAVAASVLMWEMTR